MTSWRKFWHLPPQERILILRALILLPLARLGLRTLGLRRMQNAMGRKWRCPRKLDEMEAGRKARRAARLVAVAAGFAGGTCLAQSIVLAHVLEREGIPADIRIGVRNGEQGFEAHSWVEVAGMALNETRDVGQRYAAFDRNFSPARVNWR